MGKNVQNLGVLDRDSIPGADLTPPGATPTLDVLPRRLADFATLGEYGLEPVDSGPEPCEGRHRIGARRSVGTWNAAITRFAPQPS